MFISWKAMSITILRVKRETHDELKKLKFYHRETFDDLIRRLIIDKAASREGN